MTDAIVMTDTPLDPAIPRTGPASWSYPKLYAVLWGIVFVAVVLNVLLMAGAARLFGHPGLPVGFIVLWLLPVTLLGALWMTKWVRGLIKEAANY